MLSCPSPGVLRVEAGGEVLEFAAAELELSPRLGRLARTLRMPGEGHLQLEDSPLLDAWLPARGRVEAIADWLERRRGAAIAAGLATVLGVVVFLKVLLPWMAGELAPLVPAAVERQASEQALALLDRSQLQPSRLPAARREALQARFDGLVAGLPRATDLRLAFRHAPALGANALVLPDGQVIMTDQLVALAGGDDDLLLAVLAHEAGHHEHRHAMRRALEGSAVVVVAGFLFGDLSGAGALTVSIPVVLIESGYSRGHEAEADAFAFELLRRRGLSPRAFAEAIRRLERAHRAERTPGVFDYVSTHPAGEDRIRAAEAAAAD